MTKTILCQIYRSEKHEGMYLYTEKQSALEKVPDALLERFGQAEPVMMIMLDGKKQLARASVEQVKEAIIDKGFYLQLPPQPDEAMSKIAQNNHKLF